MTNPSSTVSHEALHAAVLRKAAESRQAQQQFFEQYTETLVTCAKAMTDAFRKNGRLLTMGNGGSACDAQHIAVEFMHPIIEKRAALSAISLSTDSALFTAIANDQDASLAFAHQVKLLGRAGDIALGLSTSGQSSNVNRALQAAREMGLLTVGFSGRDGGRMREACDFCFIVPSFSIHRIQEVHTVLLHLLWDLIHIELGEQDII